MTRLFPSLMSILLFDRQRIILPPRSPFPAAAARSGGQGRPHGRRACRALPLTAASTVAGMARVGTAVAVVAVIALSVGFPAVDVLANERLPPDHDDVHGSAVDPLVGVIAEAARRFNLSPSWLRAVIRVESGGNPTAVSPKGAMGLMQVMPDTYADLRAKYGLGADPFDPHDNILAGAAYLREMLDRFGMPGFLAAYNAGPARLDNHLATGRPLPEETTAYVAALAPMLAGLPPERMTVVTQSPFAWASASLFVRQSAAAPMADRLQADGSNNGTTPAVQRQPFVRVDGLFVGPRSSGRQP